MLIYYSHDSVQLLPASARQESAPCLPASRSRSGLGVYSLHMTLTEFAVPFILSTTVLVFAALVLDVTRPHVWCVVGGL